MDSASTQAAQALPAPTLVFPRPRLRAFRGGLRGSEYAWAVAFVVPYCGVFLAFVAYPVVYGVWLGHAPSLYGELLNDPILPAHSGEHAALCWHWREFEVVSRTADVGVLYSAWVGWRRRASNFFS